MENDISRVLPNWSAAMSAYEILSLNLGMIMLAFTAFQAGKKK